MAFTPSAQWNVGRTHYVGCGFPGYGIGERIDLKKDTARLAQGRELARGIMLNYNLYRHCFPMQALGPAVRRGAARHQGQVRAAKLNSGLE
jgi:squalene-hopene/tetraprenyl-beta-curcumene cyclase